MTKTATYYLRKMPHTGPHDDLLAACRALGFDVHNDSMRSLIQYRGFTVATVCGDMLELDENALDRVADFMPAVTPEQGAAFDLALFPLNRDKTAVHEAGHAVAAHILGLKICHARIGAANEVQVCDDYEPSSLNPRDVEIIEAVQTFWAAGAAAEQIAFDEYRPFAATRDRKVVNTMEEQKIRARTHELPVAVDVFDNYVNRACRHLTKNLIVALAEALKHKSFLSRDEIRAVLEGES